MSKVSNIDLKKTAVSVLGTLVGVAAGSAAKKVLSENKTVEGLAGNAKNYIVPSVLVAAGAVAAGMTNDDFLHTASLGIAAVGGASIANEIAGKNLVTLGSASSMPRRIPMQRTRGIGNPSLLPGMSGQAKTIEPGMSGTYSLIQ